MRVLIVEDHLPVAEAIRAMLESRKFSANVVTNGEAGLDHLYAAATMPPSSTSDCLEWTASRWRATREPKACKRRS